MARLTNKEVMLLIIGLKNLQHPMLNLNKEAANMIFLASLIKEEAMLLSQHVHQMLREEALSLDLQLQNMIMM